MRLSKKILLLLISCLVVHFSIAQQQKDNASKDQYHAIHWDIENGLSRAWVSFFLKDVNGFLWISNFGLNRFDGNTFKNYFADKNSNKTIIDNYTLRPIEDSLHNIWIGT